MQNATMQNANTLNCRADTLASRTQAVERVINAMRAQWDGPMPLQAMADVAGLSPYHFNRVFRDATGVPPCHFLAALRLEAAKRLLLTTRFNVVDVCFEVGYDSLGTFTTRFTQTVGLPPRDLRRLFREADAESLAHAGAPPRGDEREGGRHQWLSRRGPCVEGSLGVPAGFEGVVFVGLFTTPVPQGRPAGCALMHGGGEFRIAGVPDGTYYALAAAVKPDAGALGFLLPGDECPRGKAGPFVVSGGSADREVRVQLREARVTDPPILVSLPMLLGEREREPVAM
jgi:AraC-like DNA-binding protein